MRPLLSVKTLNVLYQQIGATAGYGNGTPTCPFWCYV